MSTLTSYEAEIVIPQTQVVNSAANIKGNPCMEILEESVIKVTRDRGGSISDTYSDNAGEKHRCLMSMITPDFPLGIGIKVGNDGKIQFHYDALGGRDIARRICNEVTQGYMVVAVMRAQRKLGFNIHVHERNDSVDRKLVTVSGVQ